MRSLLLLLSMVPLVSFANHKGEFVHIESFGPKLDSWPRIESLVGKDILVKCDLQKLPSSNIENLMVEIESVYKSVEISFENFTIPEPLTGGVPMKDNNFIDGQVHFVADRKNAKSWSESFEFNSYTYKEGNLTGMTVSEFAECAFTDKGCELDPDSIVTGIELSSTGKTGDKKLSVSRLFNNDNPSFSIAVNSETAPQPSYGVEDGDYITAGYDIDKSRCDVFVKD